MHVAINKLRLVLRNILPFCNLIGSARIPAETKGQPKKANVSNQTHFSEGGAVGVVWGRDYLVPVPSVHGLRKERLVSAVCACVKLR